MTNPIGFIVTAIVALVVGVALGQIGMWWRLARIEGRIRNIRRAAQEYRLFEGTEIPTEWVEDQMTDFLHDEFRA